MPLGGSVHPIAYGQTAKSKPANDPVVGARFKPKVNEIKVLTRLTVEDRRPVGRAVVHGGRDFIGFFAFCLVFLHD